jgi:tetratricopeptide (TPR) repeat protein
VSHQPVALADEVDWAHLNDAGKHAYLDGEDTEARAYFKAAIKEAKDSGQSEANLSKSIFDLAQLYYMQQKYEKAARLYKQSISLDEKAIGPGHPDIAEKLSCLVATYRHLGRLDATEPLLLKALAIREQAYGSEHPLVSNTLLDLTTLYMQQGKYTFAEPLCRRALSIKEKSLGSDNLRLVPPLRIFAELLRKLERSDEATGLEQRADEIENRSHK